MTTLDDLATAYVFTADVSATSMLGEIVGEAPPEGAKTHRLRDVLSAAAGRGVRIDVVSYVANAELADVLTGAHPASRVLLRHPHGIDPSLGRKLKELGGRNRQPPWEVRVVSDPIGAAMHAKCYILHLEPGRSLCIVGSSNATRNGLRNNLEANVAFVLPATRDGTPSPATLFEALWARATPWDPRLHDPSQYLAPSAVELYAFQEEAILALDPLARLLGEEKPPGLDTEVPGFLVSLPTGAGKTLVAARFLLSRALPSPDPSRARRVLWLASTVEQRAHACRTLRRDATREPLSPLDIVEVTDEMSRSHVVGLLNEHNVVFVTEQLLASRVGKASVADIEPFDLVVVDEAHHVHEDNARYPTIFKTVRHRARLGITATPFRLTEADDPGLFVYFNPRPDKAPRTRPVFYKKLADVWDAEHHGKRIFAVPEVPKVVPTHFKVDLSRVKGDRDLDSAAFKSRKRTDKIAEAFDPKHDGPAIFFAVDVADANAITESLLARNVRVQAVHTQGPVRGVMFDKEKPLSAMERRSAVQHLAAPDGDLDAIVSVDVFIEGVDIPRLQSVFIARPTDSARVYMQMVGRAMRGPASGGTATCRIVHVVDDYVGGRHYHPLAYEEAILREGGRPASSSEKAKRAAKPVAIPKADALEVALMDVLGTASEPLTLGELVVRMAGGRRISGGNQAAPWKRAAEAVRVLVAAGKVKERAGDPPRYVAVPGASGKGDGG